MASNDQFKFGDQKLVQKILSKNFIIYDGRKTQIGIPNWCECSTKNLKIRDLFNCDGCYKLHQYKCSKQQEDEIIANDYWQTGSNFCSLCTKN